MIRGTGRYFDMVAAGSRLSEAHLLYGMRVGTKEKPRGIPVKLGEILEIPGVLDYEIRQWGHLFLHWDDALDIREMDLRWQMFSLGDLEMLDTWVREYDARNG